MTPSKVCAMCKLTLTLTEFYAHPLTKDGKGSHCRGCHRAYSKMMRMNHKNRPIRVSEQMCNCCKVVKPAGDFYRSPNNAAGITRWCKVCKLASNAANRKRRRLKAIGTLLK